MENSATVILSVVLLIAGTLGTFLPLLPGLLASFCGLLIYKYGTDADLPSLWIYIFGVLTLISIVLNYILPAQTNKKYGGTRWGSIGSFVGMVLGMIFIPVPFGFLMGMFAGVFIGELLHDRNDKHKAWNSVKGAFFGFIYGTGFNLLVGLAMLLVVTLNIFNII